MFVDHGIGKAKKPKSGECLICNSKNPTKHTTLGASFCEECWDALKDEDETAKRIVWE